MLTYQFLYHKIQTIVFKTKEDKKDEISIDWRDLFEEEQGKFDKLIAETKTLR